MGNKFNSFNFFFLYYQKKPHFLARSFAHSMAGMGDTIPKLLCAVPSSGRSQKEIGRGALEMEKIVLVPTKLLSLPQVCAGIPAGPHR